MPMNLGRLPLIDALKAVGSQLIVLHHLAFYGPMSDWTQRLAPDLVRWFSQDARMAVQVFLVIAGFLAARSLAPQGVLRIATPLRALRQRYVRTALPYLAALVVSVLCTELARQWMTHDSIPDPATAWQWFTHALLIHSLLDVDALSAGVWYVAIDFQLFALLLGLLWLARGVGRGAAVWVVGLVALASLYGFNRDADWDVWAVYFFGAYGLGVLTAWGSAPDARWHMRGVWLVLVVLTVGALWVDFRERIALALCVSLLLGWAQHGQWLQRWPRSQWLGYLGKISYSVFLLNFPVALVVNAAFQRFAPADPMWQSAGVLLGWLACNVAGALFYHGVESRLARTKR
jgi:peptidoglycan/LPS O-acetylase OafA/YrhL